MPAPDSYKPQKSVQAQSSYKPQKKCAGTRLADRRVAKIILQKQVPAAKATATQFSLKEKTSGATGKS